MATIDLKGLHRVNAKGRTYYYAWRGGPRLPGQPGSKEFVAAWHALTAGPDDASKLSGLIADYKESDAYAGLAASTKKNWGPWLDRVNEGLGKLSVKTFDKPEVRQVIKKWRSKWKDNPRAADMGKQVLSAVLSYAVEEGRLKSNPCFGIANLYSADRADHIWTPEDLTSFAKTASPEIMWALRLACLTGLRQGDLLKLQWGHIGDLAIVMPTGKSRGKLEYVVPLYDELRALLAEIPKRSTHVLTSTDGTPWAGGFGSSWNKACWAALGDDVPEGVGLEEAGWTLHFHDARGTAATKFYLAGLTTEDIAEMLGWKKEKVEGIIDRYVNRAKRLRAKIEKLGRAAAG